MRVPVSLALAFCIAVTCSSLAAVPVGSTDGEWMSLGQLSNSVQLWLKPHVVREENGMLRIWTRSDSLGKLGRGEARVMVALVEVDCAGERVRYLQLNGYRDLAMQQPTGVVSPRGEAAEDDPLVGWQYVRPSSVFELWHRAACYLGQD
jgi:hypothetical protein